MDQCTSRCCWRKQYAARAGGAPGRRGRGLAGARSQRQVLVGFGPTALLCGRLAWPGRAHGARGARSGLLDGQGQQDFVVRCQAPPQSYRCAAAPAHRGWIGAIPIATRSALTCTPKCPGDSGIHVNRWLAAEDRGLTKRPGFDPGVGADRRANLARLVHRVIVALHSSQNKNLIMVRQDGCMAPPALPRVCSGRIFP